MNNYSDIIGSFAGATVTGLALVFILVIVAICVVAIIINCKLYSKAGKPAWAAIVPIYNYIVLLDIIGFKWYYVFGFFLGSVPAIGPLLFFAFTAIIYIKLAKSFGQPLSFAAGLVFLYPIFAGIIAFKKDIKYVGPVVKGDIDFNDLF